MQPLESAKWPAELDDIHTFLDRPLNIHNIMAHHPALMKAWMPLRNHIVSNSTLSARQRELLILRTAHNCHADYEWQHHVERGRAAGLTSVEIERVKHGADAVGWPAAAAALLQAADDCHSGFRIQKKTLAALEGLYSEQQQLDITVTVGLYITLALIIRTYDVPLEHA